MTNGALIPTPAQPAKGIQPGRGGITGIPLDRTERGRYKVIVLGGESLGRSQ